MTHTQQPGAPNTGASGTGAQALDVSVILPTFNERDNICDLADAIQRELAPSGLRYEILVVDDNSPDGTADVVRAHYAMAQDARSEVAPVADGAGFVRLYVRTSDKGLAKSIRAGLEWAQGRTLVVMDTDFNHDPAMIPQMVDLLRYYDLVIGSRFVMRGGMEDQLRYRFSLLYNYFIRFLFQTQIQDNLSGFFAVRRERLLEVQEKFDQIFYGYGDYFIRLLLVAWRSNWRILEVPVFYILRRHGDSKTGFWSIFKQYTAAVLKLRVQGL
jgi:dolichol-phosphate mannosyltransferase